MSIQVQDFENRLSREGLTLLDIELINWETEKNLNKGPLGKIRITSIAVIPFPLENRVLYKVFYE